MPLQRQFSVMQNENKFQRKYNRSKTFKIPSPLSQQRGNLNSSTHDSQERNSAKTKVKGTQNKTLNALLFGRKRIVFLTKVLIQTLEITQNEFTPLLSFLLTKYMKKVIDQLKLKYNFEVTQENTIDQKEKEVLRLVILGLKEMNEKIQAQYSSSKGDLTKLVFEESYQQNDIQLRCELQTTTINHLYFKSIIFKFIDHAAQESQDKSKTLILVNDLLEILGYDDQQPVP